MNIFVLDFDPQKAAQYHCDKHVIKMILESAQLLSTCNRYFGLDEGYKSTHLNHPCSKWVRESLDNYMWLVSLGYYLNEEYKYRYNKTINHKSMDVILGLSVPEKLPDIGPTAFAQAMPDEYKSIDTVESYRAYYIIEKRDILTYTKREAPEWLLKLK